jgi:hypothetical protein
MVKPLFLLKTEKIQPANRIARKYASVVADTMLGDVRNPKLTFLRSFNGKRIVNMLSSTVFNVMRDVLLVYEDGSEESVPSNELIDIYQGAEGAVFAKAKTEDVDYCIALVKMTKFGNNQYLCSDGSFNTGYANRRVFKTLKGAEIILDKIRQENSSLYFKLKVVSAELSN